MCASTARLAWRGHMEAMSDPKVARVPVMDGVCSEGPGEEHKSHHQERGGISGFRAWNAPEITLINLRSVNSCYRQPQRG